MRNRHPRKLASPVPEMSHGAAGVAVSAAKYEALDRWFSAALKKLERRWMHWAAPCAAQAQPDRGRRRS